MQHERGDEHAAGGERRDQLGRERPAGARHLGAAGLGGEHGLVGVERPLARDVAVADRVAVLGEELAQRVGPRDPASHSRAPPAYGATSSTSVSPGSDDALAGAGAAVRARAVGGAQLDDPPRAVQLEVRRGGGEAQLDGLAAGERPGHGGGQRRRDVDDEQVARAQVARAGRGSGRARRRRSRARRRAGARRRARARGPPAARAPRARAGGRRRARSRRRPRQLRGAVAAARPVALDQGEQAGHALRRLAGGRRCPRPGRRPGACACACRPGRRRRSAGPGARRRGSRSAARARPSTSRSRPSRGTARRRRRR